MHPSWMVSGVYGKETERDGHERKKKKKKKEKKGNCQWRLMLLEDVDGDEVEEWWKRWHKLCEGVAMMKTEKTCSRKGRGKKIRKKEREILIMFINVEKNLGSWTSTWIVSRLLVGLDFFLKKSSWAHFSKKEKGGFVFTWLK